jgi:hypothetical protein
MESMTLCHSEEIRSRKEGKGMEGEKETKNQQTEERADSPNASASLQLIP